VVDRASAIVGPTLEAHGVTLETRGVSGTVWADPDKVLQVIVNLVENAAIHGPDHAEIVLSVGPDPDGGGRRVLAVADRGDPLDPDRIEELFEPHARGSTAKAKGTGLGLYIVRSIAERWGGCAWGRSGGEGNTFAVSVPVRRTP
jgi:signal transduction histidine kinase